MTEEKPPAETCPPEGGCPICRCLLPKSTVGKVVVFLALLAALVALVWVSSCRRTADDRIAEGIRLYDAKQFDAAKEAFEEALRLDAKKPVALDYLGLIALQRGDVDGALECRLKAIEIDPLSPQHHYNAAQLYFFAKKDYALAEETVAPALRLAPKAQYHLLYALCAAELGRPKEVIVARLRNVIAAGAVQVNSLRPDQLAPDGAFAGWWREATVRLEACGDRTGYDRLVELADKSPHEHVRKFAKDLMAAMEKERSQSRTP